MYAPRFLSHHNKDLEWRTLKPPRCVTALGSWTDHVIALRSWTDCVIALRQISVTALFYLEDSKKIHVWGVRARWSKDAKRRAPQRAGERERELAWAPLFMCFSLGLSYVNWASQECCLSYLRSSLWSLDLLLFHFRGLFPSLSCSHCHFGLLSPILPTWHSPLKRWEGQFFGNRGVKVFLATSCWTGTARGIGPPPLASLKPQSPYSSVHLRVSDIFHGRV